MFVAIKSDIVNDVSGKLSSRVCANRIRYFKAKRDIFSPKVTCILCLNLTRP